MIERPILFSGEMVRSILDGRKTQTRRVIKPAERVALIEEIIRVNGEFYFDLLDYEVISPYGRAGDQLWVRETWQYYYFGHSGVNAQGIRYKADNAMLWRTQAKPITDHKWRPSIHMPRWASRIDLLVKDIRVERLQDISEKDAEAEGIHLLGLPPDERYNHPRKHIVAFIELWNMINLNRGYGWEANPWVWVIEFERIGNE